MMICVDWGKVVSWEYLGLICRRLVVICCGGVSWYGMDVGVSVWVNEVGNIEELDWRFRGICGLVILRGILIFSDWI